MAAAAATAAATAAALQLGLLRLLVPLLLDGIHSSSNSSSNNILVNSKSNVVFASIRIFLGLDCGLSHRNDAELSLTGLVIG